MRDAAAAGNPAHTRHRPSPPANDRRIGRAAGGHVALVTKGDVEREGSVRRFQASGSAMCCRLLVLVLLLPPLSSSVVQHIHKPVTLNSTGSPDPQRNATATSDTTATSVATVFGSITSLLRQIPALEGLVLASCAGAFLLVVCLMLKVFRSRRRLRKTRKYDIITTPAEKVEMTPLNEDDDDDEDATVFDVKYSR
ncbi:membrane protein FAM174B [Pristis pectinata]|uniref:membrane protein FAM174B n=1 Tax=Pristis pectinata TaxID=685728 RepID=UPI00223D436A|nr:membrane protein FAM174B [Pristis pectinata]